MLTQSRRPKMCQIVHHYTKHLELNLEDLSHGEMKLAMEESNIATEYATIHTYLDDIAVFKRCINLKF